MFGCRQTKDQSKKVASLKHKEQVEKSRNARLVDEARKREDNMSESSHLVKVRACGSLSWTFHQNEFPHLPAPAH